MRVAARPSPRIRVSVYPSPHWPLCLLPQQHPRTARASAARTTAGKTLTAFGLTADQRLVEFTVDRPAGPRTTGRWPARMVTRRPSASTSVSRTQHTATALHDDDPDAGHGSGSSHGFRRGASGCRTLIEERWPTHTVTPPNGGHAGSRLSSGRRAHHPHQRMTPEIETLQGPAVERGTPARPGCPRRIREARARPVRAVHAAQRLLAICHPAGQPGPRCPIASRHEGERPRSRLSGAIRRPGQSGCARHQVGHHTHVRRQPVKIVEESLRRLAPAPAPRPRLVRPRGQPTLSAGLR